MPHSRCFLQYERIFKYLAHNRWLVKGAAVIFYTRELNRPGRLFEGNPTRLQKYMFDSIFELVSSVCVLLVIFHTKCYYFSELQYLTHGR